MWKEFKEFIMTGNVIDFAIAVILATAVGLVVNGFVQDIIMPIVGNFAGGYDFSDLQYVLYLQSTVLTEQRSSQQTQSVMVHGLTLSSIY